MKLLVIIITLGVLVYSSFSFCQSTTFRRSYDIGLFDNAGNMAQTVDGGYIFGGINAAGITFYGGLTKTDAAGDVEWSNAYVSGFASAFTDVKPVSTGGYIATGNSTSGGGGAVLVRVDATGNVIWANRYNTPNDFAGKPASETGNAVIEAADGGFVVGGSVSYFWDGVSPSTIDTSSALGFKVDASGNIQWSSVWAINSTNPDEHFFTDVTETADGFVFVGASSEGSGTLNSDGDYPRNALIVKTNKAAGSTVFINRWGVGNTSSESINAAITLSTGNVLMAGGDGSRGYLRRISGTGTTFTHQWGRRINNGFGETYLLESIAETSDNQYAFIGTRLAFGFPPPIQTALGKINPATNVISFVRTYNSLGLSSILPKGGITATDEFFVVMTDQQFTGFNYNMIKTDDQGLLNSALAGCPNGDATPGTSDYNPGVVATPHLFFTGLSGTSYAPVVTATPPTEVIHCLTTACTPPPLADNVTATPNTICAGESTTINATGPGTNVSYTVYDAATGGNNLGSVPLAVSPGTTTTYYIETIDNTDPTCVSTSRVAVEVTVNPLPIANPGSNSPLCVGETLNLTTDAVAGATYDWSGPNGFTSSDQNPTIPNVTLAADGTYSLTVTAGGCSTGPVTVDVIVSTTPTATASANNTTVCAGENIELTANTVAGGTYSWTGPNGFTSSDQNPIIPNASATEAGTYSLTIFVGSCTSVNTAEVTISVNPSPTATASATAADICEGDDIELAATAVGGATYSWNGPNGFSSTDQNPTIPNATSADGGTYSLVVTQGGCSSTNTAEVTINVNTTPTATAGATDTEICEGSDIELNANTIGGANYAWSGPNGFSSTDQNPTIPNATTADAGTYSLIITLGTCASTNTAEVSVTVNSLPSASASSNSVVCEGQDLILTATGGSVYAWTGPNGFVGSSDVETISGATLTNAGTYDVTVTDANGCENTAQTTVSISAGPSLTISGNDISCFGDTDGDAEVVATGDGPFSYSWSPSGGTGAIATGLGQGGYTVLVTDNNGCTSTENITINEPTELTISTSFTNSSCTVNDGTATVNAAGGTGAYTYNWSSGGTTDVETGIGAGIYTIIVTDGNGCTAQENVIVGSVNGPTLTLVSSEDISCFGASDGNAEVEATGGTPGYTYNWTPSGGSNAIANGLDTGTYTATVTDNAGCTAFVEVEIIEPDALNISGNATDANCGLNDGAITAIVTGGTGSYTYTWTPNSGNTAALSGLAGGAYSVVVEDANGCSVSTSFTVGVSGSIPIDVIPDITTIDAGDNVDLEVIIGGGITGADITWSPTDGLSCTTCPNPNASPSETTTYYVTVETADECFASDSVVVFVNQPCGELFVPTIFSPNNDGNNDLLCVYGGCIETINFSIYSRWGEKVFETMDPSECWDGNYKGKPMNSEVFVYKLIIKLVGQEDELIESGNINLVR